MIASLVFQACFLVCILNHCHCRLGSSPDCVPNSVRLQDGRTGQEGRLEICGFGVWGTVCNNGWNMSSTNVACRQLGIGDRGYAVVGYPASSGAIFLSEVMCSGMEQTLSECNIGIAAVPNVIIKCDHNEDVQLVCLPPEIPPECESGSIRLAGSSSPMYGRLEVCLEGVWGTVCSYTSTGDLSSAAMVACNQIGINSTKAYASGGAPGEGPILLRDLQCSGNEQNILDCPVDNTIPYDDCWHRADLSIYCYSISEPECIEGDVRLIDGPSSLEGRLEVCQDGVWGSVCDDGWKEKNSLVVCRKLGMNAISARVGKYGRSSSPYFLNDVICTGNEESIFGCTSSRYPSLRTLQCADFEAVGIICISGNETECMDGEVHLVDSSGSLTLNSSGIVALCYQGLWTFLCTRSWGLSEALAVCEDLSFPTSKGAIGFLEQNTTITGPTASVICSGVIESLYNSCSIASHECFEPGYGAVICGPPENPDCSDGDIQLSGAESPGEGCLEICHLGTWGTVCDHSWTIQNSRVACRQLGMEERDATYMSKFIERGTGPIFIDIIECMGGENNLTLCNLLTEINKHDCIHFEDVHLFCPANSSAVMSLTTLGTYKSMTSERSLDTTSMTSESNNVYNILRVVLPVVVVLIVGIIIAVIILMTMKNNMQRMKSKRENFLSIGSTAHSDGAPMADLTREGWSYNIYEDSSSSIRVTRSSHVIHSNKPRLTGLLSSEIRISNKDIQLLSKIGEGEFGVVYKANLFRSKSWSEIVAVKTLKGLYSQAEVNQILEEALKQKSFVHRNVLNLIGICTTGCPTPYLVTPYMANGSLLSYLRKEKKTLVLPEQTDEDLIMDVSKRLLGMCQQIASGMEYLAGKKFVHRDLAARNCMIDAKAIIKIADFGLCEEIYTKNYFRQEAHATVKLPIKWMAIESLQEGIFSEKTDVWSFGVTCWEVFSGGKTPYPGIHPIGLIDILEGGSRLSMPSNAACSTIMYDLMKVCWEGDPNHRPTFAAIKLKLDRKLEEMAGYLTICMNLFPEIHQEHLPQKRRSKTQNLSQAAKVTYLDRKFSSSTNM